MEYLNVTQGEESWHKARNESDGTASQAPQMMGESKYGSRDELLRDKKTGAKKEVSAKQQQIFDRGHAAEAAARPIVEALIGEPLYPVTGIAEIDGLNLLASFDGLTLGDDIVFEHKLWNKALAENVKNEILEPHYYWQLEHQLLVSGAEKAIFVVSDGTEENMVHMWYESLPERREKLIASWKQFLIDLENYEVKAVAEKIEAKEIGDFPMLVIECSGAVTTSNLPDVEKQLTEYVESFKTELVTDSDFVNAEAAVKWLADGRKSLKQAKEAALNQTQDIKVLFETIKRMDDTMQKKHSALDKLVKSEKQRRKEDIVNAGVLEIIEHNTSLESELQGYRLPQTPYAQNLMATTKNKRNIESIESGVNDAVAQAKTESNEVAAIMRANLLALEENASEHMFLFNDFADLIGKDKEHTLLIIKQRISEHEEAERQKAQREAAEKAEREKREAEAKAAKAKSILDSIKNADEYQNGYSTADSISYIKQQIQTIENIDLTVGIFGDSLEEAVQVKMNKLALLNNVLDEKQSAFESEQAAIAETSIDTADKKVAHPEDFEEANKAISESTEPDFAHNQLLQLLKDEAYEALQNAEQKFHAYASACDVGKEREEAFAVYENIRTAARQ